MSSAASFPTHHYTNVSFISKGPKTRGGFPEFILGHASVRHQKKCISFVFVNIVRDVTYCFFELGLFSLPFSAMSHYIRESPIFIEERSSVPEDQQEPFPGSSNLTAAAPWIYCLRKKTRSSLRPLNFEYLSQKIPHYFFDYKKCEKKSEGLAMEHFEVLNPKSPRQMSSK